MTPLIHSCTSNSLSDIQFVKVHSLREILSGNTISEICSVREDREFKKYILQMRTRIKLKSEDFKF